MTETFSAEDFLYLGVEEILGKRVNGHNEARRAFVSTFGTDPIIVAILWRLLYGWSRRRRRSRPKHLLWALMFLKVYTKETPASALAGCSAKTYRKWVWFFIDGMKRLVRRVIRLDYRFHGDSGQAALMTIDGTDFPIFEPSQFSPSWYTKKFNGPGLRYEVAVCIHNGDICWIHGPFPCGRFPDLKIFRLGLKQRLHKTERVWADRGYRGDIKCITPYTAQSNEHLVEMSVARARHETINGRLASWDCLNQVWRHSRTKHCSAFTSVAVIIQLEQINGFRSFQVANEEHSALHSIGEEQAYRQRQQNVAACYQN